MRRLLLLCSAVGLLCGALGCHSCHDCGCAGGCGGGYGTGHVHGRCDCDNGPEWGCHYEDYCHGGHEAAVAAPISAAPLPGAEPLKALPKEVMPKDDVK